MIFIILLSLAGMVVSIYAYMVEMNISKNPDYKPLCDLSDTISCSRAISSKYGKFVGISNSFIGMAFYAILFVLACFSAASLIFYISIAGVVASIGLAYISYFRIKSFCLVCTSVYLINVLLLLVSYAYFK
jgi:vitamin-K-epoxide reductase (warfarin-sensitive)